MFYFEVTESPWKVENLLDFAINNKMAERCEGKNRKAAHQALELTVSHFYEL